MYLRSHAKENSTCSNQWDDWACICATSLEILEGVLVRTNLISFSKSSLLLYFCFNLRQWLKSQHHRQGWILEFRSLRQTLGRVPQNSCWGAPFGTFPPRLHVALFWKTYDLLQILLTMALEWFIRFLTEQCKSVFAEIFGQLSRNSIKTRWNRIH